MSGPQKNGVAVIGVIFLLLGVLKFFTGGHWIVWIILGVLFGGLTMFGKKGAN